MISFRSCPKCDSDELCIQFILQKDESPLKSYGSLFCVQCMNCEYIGPIILCPNGMKIKAITDEWNNHFPDDTK
jgi:uncharacterized Zn finger protein